MKDAIQQVHKVTMNMVNCLVSSMGRLHEVLQIEGNLRIDRSDTPSENVLDRSGCHGFLLILTRFHLLQTVTSRR